MKKAPSFGTVALMRLTMFGLQNPVADFAATAKEYRPDFKSATVQISCDFF